MSELIHGVEQAGDVLLVRLGGEVTLSGAPDLHGELLELMNPPPARMVVELSAVKHIDSAGVGTLVDVLRRIRQHDGVMALSGMNRNVKSLFEITRLDQLFQIFDSEQEALDG